jgi:hypothetical protein
MAGLGSTASICVKEVDCNAALKERVTGRCTGNSTAYNDCVPWTGQLYWGLPWQDSFKALALSAKPRLTAN